AVKNQPLFSQGAKAPFVRQPQLGREFLCRIGLVALSVAITYQFDWNSLRFLTSEVILQLSATLGMPTFRFSPDTVNIHGHLFQFSIACTFIDAGVGAIPLLLDFRKSLLRNVSRLAACAVFFGSFNVFRLEIGHLLYAHNVPWALSHGVVGGFFYFAVWLLIWRQRGWIDE